MHQNPGVSVEKGGEIPEALKFRICSSVYGIVQKSEGSVLRKGQKSSGKAPAQKPWKTVQSISSCSAAGEAEYEQLVSHTQRHLCPHPP